jgi:hypothetical protein
MPKKIYQIRCVNCFESDLQLYMDVERHSLIISCNNCESLVALIKVEKDAVNKFKKKVEETL